MNKNFYLLLSIIVPFVTTPAFPQTDNESVIDYEQKALDACLANASIDATSETTIGELKDQCLKSGDKGPIQKRYLLEERVSSNPFAILPHRQNYLLPFSYSELEEDIYEERLHGHSLDDVETEFQISIKFLIAEDLLAPKHDLEFGFTTTSWWQTYNGDISSPFRETNYEPELIFRNRNPWSLFGLPVKNSHVALNHQSNGQAGSLSRSWNRVIAGIAVEHDYLVWGAQLWWRIPEDEKDNATDSSGDDNPDIEKFVGQGQIGILWKTKGNHNLQMQLRNNLRSNNRGSIKLGWSFPFSDHLRGYVQYFNGYGESLISYNETTSRIGFGFLLTDWL